MPLKQSKLKTHKSEKNAEEFLPGTPAFMIKPKKEKGIDGIYFNQEAIDLLELNKLDTDGKTLFDKLVFIESYTRTDLGKENESEEPVFHVTTEKEIEWGKKYKSCQFYSGTKSITSKIVYDTLVSKYELDQNKAHYFVLDKSKDADESDIFFISELVSKEEIFDEGKKLTIKLEQLTHGTEENPDV